jgi:alkylation response protein AidB-like acyl-CoA dehydrogenase
MSDTLVRDSAARLFADLVTPQLINAAEAGEFPREVWDALEEAGFPDALAASTDLAGSLGGIADAAAILHEAGRHAAPLPLAETMIGRWLLEAAGYDTPDGIITIAPVDGEGGFGLRRDGEGWRLSGRATLVPWATKADAVAVVADGHVMCFAPGDADVRPGRNLAGEPRDDLSVDVALDAVTRAPGGVDGALVYRLGALFRAVMMAGALDEVLKLTVQYANDRVQFGRPIAKFQAIQQQLAILAEHVAAAGVVAQAAVEAAVQKGDLAFAVAVAKSRVGEAAGKVAEIAHQVHGAIGFTHEHRLHHLTRRLWSWRDEFGVESDWERELGRMAALRGGDELWPMLSAW